MGKKVSHAEYVRRIQDKYPGKYTFLSEFIDAKTDVYIKHNKCGHDVWMKPRYITLGFGCGVCRPSKPLSENYIKMYIKDNFKGYEYLGGYKNNNKSIMVKHNCGCEFSITPQTLLYNKNCNCPKCFNKNHNCVTGANDIETSDPWMFELLVDKEFGKTHKSGSRKETLFKCPTCGENVFQKPCYVGLYGVNCPKCKTSISYPERFFANILDQCRIDYKYQFSPDWAGKYRYDYKFNIDKKKIILELDGGFHYMYNNLSGKSREDQLSIDMEKQKIAEEHGFEVIRIDCNYGGFDRFEYIKNHILNSSLSEIIDFSKVDFELCNSRAIMHLAEIIANAWNKGNKTVNDLCDELKMSNTTIWKRLKEAYEIGLIKESPNQIKRINRVAKYKKYGHPNEKTVVCNETGEVFQSIREASKKYHANIYAYFSDKKRKHAGTLSDGTKLTWTLVG